ncbi:hypothetical protein [Sphingobacterium hungaricum]|uniref:Uncharacterized protein n=1 Tax=Sphingobacterium hungaricum TaxID=2082723 RepID=A0A928UXE1_9SPHI|nr:hypothetical protein [Sphingobacterium hungaricum]MBE8712532.1 hypothetical protein [Sphingobacterium hungaricum]
MKSFFLQAPASDGGSVVTFIVVFAIAILVFFVLRNVILWYYKLDVISRNIEGQTEILKAILRKMESKNDGHFNANNNQKSEGVNE